MYAFVLALIVFISDIRTPHLIKCCPQNLIKSVLLALMRVKGPSDLDQALSKYLR